MRRSAGLVRQNAALFDDLAIHPFRRNGYTAYIVVLPPPIFSPESYFSAIVYKVDPKEYGRPSPSTRYFTLEKTSTEPEPVLCEWRPALPE